jgi:8-oxo-dGTP pyrophosphatase MutT (NUDIX family)
VIAPAISERWAERWDLLDEDGRPVGRTALRWEPLREGERHLVVHVYLVNGEGRYLIQKRSMAKELLPGIWDVTGGAVLAGEDSRQGAFREVEEELGLRLEPGALVFIARLKRPDCFVDLWLGRMEARLGELTLQPEEVDAVRFVDADELMEAICVPLELDDAYRAAVERVLLAGA